MGEAEGLRALLGRSSFIWPEIGPETLREILVKEARNARHRWKPYRAAQAEPPPARGGGPADRR